ncbi:hypothetical protein BOX15_Mlig005947g1 [Macrostomum lignano]|uniref:Uncharacterized protein n=1 Tax=Macrostomum lignano TaxID=282301 RepID=A0A267ENB8_9PLAT|nr:hypothetical protein BOX15_Mlig005947g2 [Macrostomum lignano]PAA72061.1 hypothetical protein BOX15_Mlig005947g1 [Macrostomum lignano]
MKYLIVSVAILAAFISNAAASITCYSRSSSTSYTSNGTTTLCAFDSSCYTYDYGEDNFAGCGTCSGYSYTTCKACTASYCNTRPPVLNCYYSNGDYLHSSRRRRRCESSYCYEYSFTYATIDIFFAGCGECSKLDSYSNCRACNSGDYCNSAASLRGWNFTAFATAVILAMIRLL